MPSPCGSTVTPSLSLPPDRVVAVMTTVTSWVQRWTHPGPQAIPLPAPTLCWSESYILFVSGPQLGSSLPSSGLPSSCSLCLSLQENTGGDWSEEQPDPDVFWGKIGWKLPRGHKDAPADHSGDESCQCSCCRLPAHVWVRVFRQAAMATGLATRSVWNVDMHQVVLDTLHCIMR